MLRRGGPLQHGRQPERHPGGQLGAVGAVPDLQDLALGMPTSKRLASGQYEVTFRHSPAGPAKSVALVGTFTGSIVNYPISWTI